MVIQLGRWYLVTKYEAVNTASDTPSGQQTHSSRLIGEYGDGKQTATAAGRLFKDGLGVYLYIVLYISNCVRQAMQLMTNKRIIRTLLALYCLRTVKSKFCIGRIINFDLQSLKILPIKFKALSYETQSSE